MVVVGCFIIFSPIISERLNLWILYSLLLVWITTVIQIIYHIIIIVIADFYDFFLGSSGGDVTTSTKVTVYRGPKGSFHRKQENPRASRKTDWLAVFISNYCQGSEDECRQVLGRFESFNESGNKKEANGILSVYVEQGARECMLREVFKIGSERYKKFFITRLTRLVGGEMALR